MSDINRLVVAWVSAQQRHFCNSTRGIATPEQRLAWEAEAEQIIAQHDQELRAEIAADIRAEHRVGDYFQAYNEGLNVAAQVAEGASE